MALGETITVINRSGKVVSSSKHLVNVFKEARSAYRERKAEIQAERNAALATRKLREGVKSIKLEDDTRSRGSGRSRRSKSHQHSKPPLERGYTDSFYANDELPRPRRPHPRSPLAQDIEGERHGRELMRRNTDGYAVAQQPLKTTRSQSESHIDMDLAYGDLPPPLPVKKYEDGELREKASKLTRLLEEANCVQYSVTTMIENLQKNPDAMAAVALTLAEISNIVGKMGPGVVTALKGSFPAVFALLASPQFMIAAGVGVGVTIVALGGYKIIKKIQAQKEEVKLESAQREMEEPLVLDELQTQELSRIELWRRGIADVAAASAGTSVDGEFVTPGAARTLVAAGVLDKDDLRSRRASRIKEDGERKPRSQRAKSVKSTKTSGTHRSQRSSSSTKDKDGSKKKKKEPSGLKMLFRSHSH